jgi:hypothetical protein
MLCTGWTSLLRTPLRQAPPLRAQTADYNGYAFAQAPAPPPPHPSFSRDRTHGSAAEGGIASGADALAFSRTVNSRFANAKFRTDAVPEPLLRRLLELTQRAPSSFNVQPYTCVVVRDGAARARLATAMMGANGAKVTKKREIPSTPIE